MVQYSLFAGCVHAGAVLCMCAYRTLVRSEYQVRVAQLYRPPFTHSVPFFFATVLGAALAVAVVLCVGFLFVLQLYTVIRNKTGIESFICEKAEGARSIIIILLLLYYCVNQKTERKFFGLAKSQIFVERTIFLCVVFSLATLLIIAMLVSYWIFIRYLFVKHIIEKRCENKLSLSPRGRGRSSTKPKPNEYFFIISALAGILL